MTTTTPLWATALRRIGRLTLIVVKVADVAGVALLIWYIIDHI